MKKITILSLHLNYGGIEKYISDLCSMLEKDYKIELIITYKMNENPAFSFNNKIKIKYLINDKPNKEELRRVIKRKKPLKIIKEIFKSIKILYLKRHRTIKAIKKLDTDYLITTRLYETKLVNKYLKKSKIKKIATEHNYPTKKYLKRLTKSLTNYDKLIVVNEEIKKLYQEVIGMKVDYIPNTIEKYDDAVSKLNTKNIIAVGRLEYEKGFSDLLDTMKLIAKEDNNVHLTIIGDGSEKNKLLNQIKELKLENNVTLTGFLSQDEIRKYMLTSSLYVMSSITESFGIVLLEAMTYALPVVAFDSGAGAKDLIKDTGVLIKDRNQTELKSTIISLLNNKTELKKLSKNSLEKVKQYYKKNVKTMWKNILNEVDETSNKRVLFISSTGGHFNELMMLSSMFKKYKYSLITEKTETSKNIKTKYGKKYTKFVLYGTRKKMTSYPFILLINCFLSLYYFILYRPKYIVTTGSHTAGPICVLGKIFKTKIIFIETFANSTSPTATGKIIYKFADLFIVQWKSMLKIYEKAEYGGWIY